jgi:hypothetical protein
MFLSPRFKKDALISLFIIVGIYTITHNPLTRPTPKPEPGLWSIQFMQHPLLFGLAGHNYLVLRDENGSIVKELHGLATDKETYTWKYIGTRGTDLLQVWEFTGPRNYLSSKQYPGVVLTQGHETAMEATWSKGEDCVSEINKKQIPYPPFGISIKGETENSNSVAYTLALCMNLDPHHIGIFTPGSQKNLLAN